MNKSCPELFMETLTRDMKRDLIELTKEAREKKFKEMQRRLHPDKFNDIESLVPLFTEIFQNLAIIKKSYIDGTLEL